MQPVLSAGQKTAGADDGDLSATVGALNAARAAWRARRGEVDESNCFPSRDAVAQIVDALAAALYPRRLGRFRGATAGEDAFVSARLIAAYGELERQVAAELGYWQAEASAVFDGGQAGSIVRLFGSTLGRVRALVDSDIDAAFQADPAARTADEILVCYPGVVATLHHRLAHELHMLGAPIVARMIAELANERTGIDIHPGATIGSSFFIDHGTGVVIGETAIVGDRVRLYQHVTLGARSALGQTRHGGRRRYDRHPIVEDDVVIYAGATILGRVTIGARSTIGGNVWLLSDVSPDSLVVQPEARLLEPPIANGVLDALVEAAWLVPRQRPLI